LPTSLGRCLGENADSGGGVERDVLVAARGVFSAWMKRLGQKLSDTDSRLFMLSVHSVMLIYLLDSQSYQSVLGGSVRSGPLREQVRAHVRRLLQVLLATSRPRIRMRALIAASFDPAAKARLARHMDVVHEDWKERQSIYFDGAAFARRITEAVADVLIVEADLVHSEVLDTCPLKMIGVCRGDPI